MGNPIFSVHTQSFLGTQPCPFIYVLPVAPFSLWWWRWVEPAQPLKPQIPPIWIFTENANLCSIRKSYLTGVQLSTK